MQAFMNRDFLLTTETARALYHDVAAKCPIIDYHCHIQPREIWEDACYENITQVWLGADHYKWRLMRAAGVPEEYITGGASDWEKFEKWAAVLERAIGNPLYHWSHLELRRFFGYEGVLGSKTAREVWELCARKLAEPGYGVRGLIGRSNVETICTTDDPVDSLEWHQKLAKDPSFPTAVLPAWRPDRAMNLEKPDYGEYLSKLSECSGVRIDSFAALKDALRVRMAFFAENGCRLSDHALSRVFYAPAAEAEVEAIFERRLSGALVRDSEQAKFKTAFMLFAAREYRRMDWTMQLHYGCVRDNNPTMFRRLGPDSGYDAIDNFAPSAEAAAFLGALEDTRELPRTILYSLNPADNPVIDALCGCFQSDEAVGKLQHGSAWWFNDHFDGMVDQLRSLASIGSLGGFVGMLTDSRSFLSYPRHEYFRRILCRLIGEWVEQGMFPKDLDLLAEIVRGVSADNARRYFGFARKG